MSSYTHCPYSAILVIFLFVNNFNWGVLKMILRSKSKLFSTLLTGFILIALNSFTVAKAGDGKSWSGALCQPYYGYDEASFHNYASGIYNRSSSSKWVSCGISKDRYGTRGTEKARVYVTASSSRKTTCTLSERYTSGGSFHSKSSARFGSGYIYIDTSRSKNSGNNSRVIFCLVPTGGKVASIYVQEF